VKSSRSAQRFVTTRRLSVIVLVAGCAPLFSAGNPQAAQPGDADPALRELLRHSFRSKGGVQVDSMLTQDAVQQACSRPDGQRSPAERTALQAGERSQVRFPPDGNYFGDWRRGEVIAQSGRGRQFSDAPNAAAGGNCYACHQLDPKEAAYGTIGPSLAGYGRSHGQGEEILRTTWIRLWNAQALTACTSMPRFGQQGILSVAQLRDVMALLFASDSPVNQPPTGDR
jgi:sulfur-oxidizing protein SoxX